MNNIPNVKLGIIAVSRDCFPITLSASRRDAIASAYNAAAFGEDLYNCPVTVENEKDALKAVAIPAVEVHLSQVDARESFRQISYAGMYCEKTITGQGIQGYRLAMQYLVDRYQ